MRLAWLLPAWALSAAYNPGNWWETALELAQEAYPPGKVFLVSEGKESQLANWWPQPTRANPENLSQNLVLAVHEACHYHTRGLEAEYLPEGFYAYATFPKLLIASLPAEVGGRPWPPNGIVGLALPQAIRSENGYYPVYLTNRGTLDLIKESLLTDSGRFLPQLEAVFGKEYLDQLWGDYSQGSSPRPADLDPQDGFQQGFLSYLALKVAPAFGQASKGFPHLVDEYNCYIHSAATALGLVKSGFKTDLSSEAYALASFEIFTIYYLIAMQEFYPENFQAFLNTPGLTEVILGFNDTAEILIASLASYSAALGSKEQAQFQLLRSQMNSPEVQEIITELADSRAWPAQPSR